MLTDESENSFQALVKKQANVMIRKFVHIYDEKLFLILVTMKQIKEHFKCYTQLHNQAAAFKLRLEICFTIDSYVGFLFSLTHPTSFFLYP